MNHQRSKGDTVGCVSTGCLTFAGNFDHLSTLKTEEFGDRIIEENFGQLGLFDFAE